ncbi:MAG: molybdenum cofactor guanylyltransferase [Anaerolineae bacterium]|jgi:molybdopterin-guanine dinucleotide biosynthesis protein A|nr:molybdenum cofactor guanylyltransferase [Anaerolineae bacterium]
MGADPAEAEGAVQAISAVVLAGGESRRLGQDKCMLLVEGQSLLDRTLGLLASLAGDLVVVSNDPRRTVDLPFPVRLVPDRQPGVGALMGLYSGLHAARHDRAVAVACDMPFLSLPLLRHMVSLSVDYDVVLPRLGDLVEPLHAVYGKGCLGPMERQLSRGRRRIVSFFDDVRVCYVEQAEVDRYDPRHLSFLNVNTPDDWQRVQALLRQPE